MNCKIDQESWSCTSMIARSILTVLIKKKPGHIKLKAQWIQSLCKAAKREALDAGRVGEAWHAKHRRLARTSKFWIEYGDSVKEEKPGDFVTRSFSSEKRFLIFDKTVILLILDGVTILNPKLSSFAQDNARHARRLRPGRQQREPLAS